ALVVHFPGAPVSTGIGRGDGALAVRNGVCGVGQILAVRRTVLGRVEAQSAVGVQVQAGALCAWRRPRVVRVPGVGPALKGLCLPGEFFALAVQPKAEEGRFDLFAELRGSIVSAEPDQPEALRLGCVPLSVEPGSGNDEVSAVRIFLRGAPEDLPRTPGVLLIEEAGDVQVGYRGGLELHLPRLLLPKGV